MAIDYYGRFPCKVRESASDADLLRMEKAKNRAESVLELMRAKPSPASDKPESEWSFNMVVMGPNGPEQSTLRVADLLQEAAPLSELSPHCAGCPFKLNGWDFGCGGAIHYPICAETEAWLLSRLPEDLSSHAGVLLLAAIKDYHFDGAHLDAMRSQGDVLALPKPPSRRWGGFFSRKAVITSSQILHMMFGVGTLAAPHAKAVAHILGFVDDNGSPVFGPDERAFPTDAPGVVSMKQFLRIMSIAGTRGVEVLLDA